MYLQRKKTINLLHNKYDPYIAAMIAVVRIFCILVLKSSDRSGLQNWIFRYQETVWNTGISVHRDKIWRFFQINLIQSVVLCFEGNF